jgi:hypothetical protein
MDVALISSRENQPEIGTVGIVVPFTPLLIIRKL